MGANAAQDILPGGLRSKPHLDWVWNLLLVVVLAVGAYFRFVGVDWDQNQHLHPDERFLTMVATAIAPVETVSDYFNTATSALNPHNRGFGFFVYGTLPMFVVRYVGEWLGKTGYDQIHLVGRQVSGVMDLGTVLVVYLTAAYLFRNRRLALLASAFAAFSVLPIQLSHYFTVDTFTNFFGMLALYFAVRLLPIGPEWQARNRLSGAGLARRMFTVGGSAGLYVLFGIALGLAMASKINAALLAALLPAAVGVRFFSQPPAEREQWLGIYLRNLVIAALVSIVVFRIFQPYAFSGPGFFNFVPNPLWVENLRSLAAQSTGDVDFPPALQWARRPIWFSLQNLVLWGLGLPLGLLAWAGFFWMGYRILRGEWKTHLLIWGWTGLYFAYQSINFTSSMRYQMLIYPALAIMAAWAVFALWDRTRTGDLRPGRSRVNWSKVAAVLAGLSVLAATFGWAFAFTRIYTRPVTRVAASRWIYQNIPGPLNLNIETENGVQNQPLAFRSGYTLRSAEGPLVLAFRPRQAGELVDVRFEHLVNVNIEKQLQILDVAVRGDPQGNSLASAQIMEVFQSEGDPRGGSYSATFGQNIILNPSRTYYLILTLRGEQQSLALSGTISYSIYTEQGTILQVLPEPVDALKAGESYQLTFTASQTGQVRSVELNHVVDWEAHPENKTLRLSLLDSVGTGRVLGQSERREPFAAEGDVRGESYVFTFDPPVQVVGQQQYAIRLEHAEGPGVLAVYGSKQANESSWDDALPVGLDGYNPYDYSYGVYRSDLNFEMYWDDNQDKLDRFQSILDQADAIFISSNRQWGTTVRLPERYPLTSQYYRSLLGCPAEKEITWCYSMAEPGMFQGELGFELAAVFQSDPNLGGLRFNTQFAEEAFTVYDHPKVLIFRKSDSYDPDRVRAILGAVDLSTVVHLTPRQAGANPGNLLLPDNRLAQQRARGTWAALFDTRARSNRFPGLGALLWYGAISLLGWVLYPFTRLALHGLPDRGYPLARLVGMLALAYPVWLLGSYQVPFSRLTIWIVFISLLAANLALAYVQRKSLARELRERWKYFLMIEGLFLLFFLVFLMVRLGNADLWHPWKGGEKPMDFSYFNAVLKSTTFPPYDPWFAGGYINYYYYGFVLVGVPVKWLGIVPALAYNLILPTLFALLGLGAFSVGWNLLSAVQQAVAGRGWPAFNGITAPDRRGPLLGGLGASLATVVMGNWGSVRMIWHGLQRLAELQVPFEEASLLLRIQWTFEGLVRLVTVPGTRLPYGPGDWYWIPSRAIPGEPITEFPAFTFLYADLHAHMIALPVTILALSWALAVLLGKWNWAGRGHAAASFLLGGLAVGTLRPTNTWDWPAFLALGCAAVVYTALRYGQPCRPRLAVSISLPVQRFLIALAGVLALVLLSTLLYQPYARWYGEGYNQIDPWNGPHTPFWSYLTHWGVFLFVIVSWLAWETIDWMAATPVSGLNRLRPYRGVLLGIGLMLVAFSAALWLQGVEIGWLVVWLGAWCAVLLFRPGQPDSKRAVLFMTGAALALTLFVELAVLRGDIGRMNTVFKFYLQAWTLLALSAGASLFWVLPALARSWRSGWQTAWETALALLVAGAMLFPVLAGVDKINDRMVRSAPRTLDGMAYMAYASYSEGERTLNLSEDYRAIRWMQENVPGSPVIVEANVPEYRWGSRFTIYTGLPGVVGWNWHQRQQRAIVPGEWVFNRVNSIHAFYNTTSPGDALDFLRKYSVEYIVVGQLERAVYSLDGLQKFTDWNGKFWQEIYRDGQTSIYQVTE